jgi:DHA1 family bicyclomycin/chloramphenicol resistance-like MFS transporter
VVLRSVEHELGISRSYAALSVSLFVVAAAAVVLLWGHAAERYGRRTSILAALALFIVASAQLALNTSAAGLLILRSLQGIGAGEAAIIARIFVGTSATGRRSRVGCERCRSRS